MRKSILVAVLALLTCLTGFAGTREDAVHVCEQWTAAFNARNLDAIVNLYAPDALFFGTGSRTLAASHGEIRKYFEQAFAFGPQAAFAEPSVVVLSETAAVVTGLDNISGATGRVTFVVGKRQDGWKIIHFHRSSQP